MPGWPLALVLLVAGLLTAPFAAVAAAPAPVHGACREIKGLIILAEFPDVPHRLSTDQVRRRFFHDLDGYVRSMSYGRYCLGGDLSPRWYTLPRPVSEYRISPRNLEVDRTRVRQLIDDALGAVARDADFSRYDFTAVFLGARRQDYGMIGLCGYPGMLGWEATEALHTPGGQPVRGGVAIFSYEAHLGTLFHDVAHIMGGVRDGKRGLPCLYDHDLQARPSAPTPRALREVFLDAAVNVGLWDPMSSHFVEWRLPPAGISSWTRLRLGWLEPRQVREVSRGETAEVTLGPLAGDGGGTVAIRVPLTAATYYLVENRQPVGFDSNLPGSGVLILLADDRVAECRHGKVPVRLMNADPSQPHLRGAAFELGKSERFVDERNGVEVRLLGKDGHDYRVLVKSAAR